MISMALMAGIIVLVASNFKSPKNEIRKDITNLMILTKKSFQYAQIKNATFRIVIDMTGENEDGEEVSHKYWVEYASGPQFIPSAESEDKLDEDGNIVSEFQVSKSLSKKKESLPPGFIFTSVSYGGREDIDKGLAYLYFFPQGYTEESLIQIGHKENKLHWSILVNPLTGISDLLTRKVSLKDLKQGK